MGNLPEPFEQFTLKDIMSVGQRDYHVIENHGGKVDIIHKGVSLKSDYKQNLILMPVETREEINYYKKHKKIASDKFAVYQKELKEESLKKECYDNIRKGAISYVIFLRDSMTYHKSIKEFYNRLNIPCDFDTSLIASSLINTIHNHIESEMQIKSLDDEYRASAFESIGDIELDWNNISATSFLLNNVLKAYLVDNGFYCPKETVEEIGTLKNHLGRILIK